MLSVAPSGFGVNGPHSPKSADKPLQPGLKIKIRPSFSSQQLGHSSLLRYLRNYMKEHSFPSYSIALTIDNEMIYIKSLTK